MIESRLEQVATNYNAPAIGRQIHDMTPFRLENGYRSKFASKVTPKRNTIVPQVKERQIRELAGIVIKEWAYIAGNRQVGVPARISFTLLYTN